ncbi:hypothetical protein GYB22_12140 [bacterium]|nr:hypothetical protein [bacterium]
MLFSIFLNGLVYAQPSDDLYIDAYVLVVDTSLNYSGLREKMFDLSESCKIEIDTMGRSFDSTRNLICLPDDAEDEIYAGEYFARRYPSVRLSLEYFHYYSEDNCSEKMIALIACISTDPEMAETLLESIKPQSISTFIIRKQIFMGCGCQLPLKPNC